MLPGHDDGSDRTKAIRALNEKLAGDRRLVVAMLPIRDGVALVRRA